MGGPFGLIGGIFFFFAGSSSASGMRSGEGERPLMGERTGESGSGVVFGFALTIVETGDVGNGTP